MKNFRFNAESRPLTEEERKKSKLNQAEVKDIEAIENEEYKSAKRRDFQKVKLAFQKTAAALRTNNTRMISIRLDKDDLISIQNKAKKEGLPYQSYIKSQLHKLAVK